MRARTHAAALCLAALFLAAVLLPAASQAAAAADARQCGPDGDCGADAAASAAAAATAASYTEAELAARSVKLFHGVLLLREMLGAVSVPLEPLEMVEHEIISDPSRTLEDIISSVYELRRSSGPHPTAATLEQLAAIVASPPLPVYLEGSAEEEAARPPPLTGTLRVPLASKPSLDDFPGFRALSEWPGPRVYVVDDFLSAAEVDDARAHIQTNFDAFSEPGETGISMEMPALATPLFREIKARKERLLGFANVMSEHDPTFRVRLYRDSQRHSLHTDTYDFAGNTLIVTMLVYLTDTESGGDTFFPLYQRPREGASEALMAELPAFEDDADFERPGVLSVRPRKGRLIMWFSCTPTGESDPLSTHGSRSVGKGSDKLTLTTFVYQDTQHCAGYLAPNETERAVAERLRMEREAMQAPGTGEEGGGAGAAAAAALQRFGALVLPVGGGGSGSGSGGGGGGGGGAHAAAETAAADGGGGAAATPASDEAAALALSADRDFDSLDAKEQADFEELVKSHLDPEEGKELPPVSTREEREALLAAAEAMSPGVHDPARAAEVPGLEVLSRWPGPRVYRFRDFASDAEVDYLVNLTVSHRAEFTEPGQTGISLELDVRGDALLEALAERQYGAATALGVPNNNEVMPHTMRLRRYEANTGQLHPVHTDSFAVSSEHSLLVTMLVYLTDVEEGGETYFSHAHKRRADVRTKFSDDGGDVPPESGPMPDGWVSVRPRRGDMLVWFSCSPDGVDDHMSLHGSRPVTRGAKVTATNFVYANRLHCRKHAPLPATWNDGLREALAERGWAAGRGVNE